MTGLATLPDWVSLLLKMGFGYLPRLGRRRIAVTVGEGIQGAQVLKDSVMPLSRFLKKMLIRTYAMIIFTMTHHAGKKSLSA